MSTCIGEEEIPKEKIEFKRPDLQIASVLTELDRQDNYNNKKKRKWKRGKKEGR